MYHIQAFVDTILCYKSDMTVLGYDYRNFCNAIDSAPARYERILKYHPYIRTRLVTELRSTGYIFGYPTSLFRCEYIIHLLYLHIEICTFSSYALQSFIKLRYMYIASNLRKIYNVSYTFMETINQSPQLILTTHRLS